MIRMVYEQAAASDTLDQVVVATDDQRIFDEVKGFGGQVMLSKKVHENGTERCAEVLETFSDYDYVINIQCDEPFLKPGIVDELGSMLDGTTELATLISEVRDKQQLANPNMVKAVINRQNEAIYFSRSAIPFMRDGQPNGHTYYKHLGIYGYRADILRVISTLPTGTLEAAEKLEQLRWIENGYTIKVNVTLHDEVSIDTPEDLKRAKQNT